MAQSDFVFNGIDISGTSGTTITLPSSTGTLPLNNQTFYIGTQQIAINAGSGTITSLPGVTSINGATLPSSGTIPNTGQTFYIGTQAVTISQGSGTVTTLPGVTSVNGTTIPSSSTLVTSGANSSITSLTGLTTALSISQGGTGATTASTAAAALLPSQTSNSGKYLTTDGSGNLSWASVSGYSAPTIGSTSIASGSTVTTIAGLTLSSPTINTPTLTLSTSSSTSNGVISWDTTNKKLQVGNGSATVDIKPYVVNQTAITSSYTLALTDANTLIQLNDFAAGAATITVPLNSSVAFPIGTQIDFINLNNTYRNSFAFASGITSYYTPGLYFRTAGSMASLIKIGSDTWALTGDLSAS